MDILTAIIQIMDLITATWFHYMFSGFVGFLVFSWILITFSDVYQILLGHVLQEAAPRYFILGLALCSALLSAWYVHVLMDIITTWWTSPLGPPI